MRKHAELLCVLVATFGIPIGLLAHDPLDCSTQIIVSEDHIEVAVTLGLDGVREVLSASGFSQKAIAETVVSRGPQSSMDLPVALAARFFEVNCDGEMLAAKSVAGLSDGMEVVFNVKYPRPAQGILGMRAVYFDEVARMRPGWLVALDEDGNQLFGGLLSRTGDKAAQWALPPLKTDEQLLSVVPAQTHDLANDGESQPMLAGELVTSEPWLRSRTVWLGGMAVAGLWLATRRRRIRKGANVF